MISYRLATVIITSATALSLFRRKVDLILRGQQEVR
jgi:hypothetical protein